jgi:RNA polymerase sigma factor (sigma-70 family)
MGNYLLKPVEELAKQLSAGLTRLRKDYVDAAESLLSIVQPDLEYPYELVLYRLTGYRSARARPIQPLAGKALRHDLRALILEICDSFDLKTSDYGQAAYNLRSLAQRLRVSTKTVQRWCKSGLVARRLVFPDGKKRLAFLSGSVRSFARQRRRQVLRSVRFSQMSQAEVDFIVRRARRMALRQGGSLLAISRRLARRTARAVETIRYTLRNYDRANPGMAIFPGQSSPLDAASRQAIYRCFLHGISASTLAGRYRRTRGSIYRLINEARARALLQRKMEYIYNPQFDLPEAQTLILAPDLPPPPPPAPVTLEKGDDTEQAIMGICQAPLLTATQERALFQQYNFLKYQADHLRQGIDCQSARSVQLRRIERLLMQAESLKSSLVRANLRLVVSIARRHLRGPQSLMELISDGTVSLMKAVEKFDYARGFKFSTYASWAIIKNFARSVPQERYRLDRFATAPEEMLDVTGGLSRYDARAVPVSELRDCLEVVLAQLSPRERSILVNHYGLDQDAPPQTLEELSRHLGISKERVRQIELKAMGKLRHMLQPDRQGLLG